MSKETYLIYGYDLTEYRNEILNDEFCDSEEYEDFTCYQTKGNIQIFEDSMYGDYLYLGYIIGTATDDLCEDDKIEFDMDEFLKTEKRVELHELCGRFVKGKVDFLPKAKLILFSEFR